MSLKKDPLRIMIIDDEELDNIILKMLLKKAVIDPIVDIASDGEKAIIKLTEIFKTHPKLLPDVIFLDLNMPNKNGWQFLAEFKKLNIDPSHKIHIYILSSSISNRDITESLANELVDDFLHKPLDILKIKSILREAA